MQKLDRRNTYTPTDASQVRSNCDLVVKHDCEVGQVPQDLKTLSNNSDENRHSDMSGQNLRVFVINMRGESLMPTTPRKARILLKQGKAKVVKRTPFTIRLKYATGEAKQPITLGVDAGYSKIGFSAVTEKQELISGEIKLRNDISKKLTARKMYRGTRRSRLWHREPRFDNRNRKKGWLAPSLEHKLQSHIKLVERIKQILPITKTIVEVASFDTQKIQKPEIEGIEYQQGELQGYEVREYLLEKWKRKCAYCKKSNIPLQTEHIIPKSRGGSNRVSNLTISCNKCNQKKDNKTAKEFGYPNIQKQAKKSLKSTAFMNNIRWKLVNLLECSWTYGYITKYNRIKLGLDKSHSNDAFVVAGGTSQERMKPFISKQTRRNNRAIQTNRKGFKPSIRRKRYKLQPNDLVRYNNLLCRVKGVSSYGKWIVLVDPKRNRFDSNIKNVELIKYGKGFGI